MASVVHVYKDYPPVCGGIEGHVDVLTRMLVERGVSAEVLCRRPRGTRRTEDRLGVAVRRCASPLTLASTPLPPALPLALWRSRARLIHLHYPWPPAEVAWWLAARGRPTVVTVHCEVVRFPAAARILAPLTDRVLASAGRILVASPAMREIPLLAAHAGRVRIVPYGVDLDHFLPDPDAVDPLPGVPHPRVLFTGRLRYYKGLPVLVAALARLPRAQLVVAGDGPERSRLEEELRQHGCESRARVLGEVDDATLLRLMQTSDAAVLPSTSRAEAFGLSIAEAQACGLPAVTTEVGTGTGRAVADGKSGRVVRPSRPDELAEALAWCLDPEGAPSRRTAAREHAEKHLCARRMTDDVLRVYEELLAD